MNSPQSPQPQRRGLSLSIGKLRRSSAAVSKSPLSNNSYLQNHNQQQKSHKQQQQSHQSYSYATTKNVSPTRLKNQSGVNRIKNIESYREHSQSQPRVSSAPKSKIKHKYASSSLNDSSVLYQKPLLNDDIPLGGKKQTLKNPPSKSLSFLNQQQGLQLYNIPTKDNHHQSKLRSSSIMPNCSVINSNNHLHIQSNQKNQKSKQNRHSISTIQPPSMSMLMSFNQPLNQPPSRATQSIGIQRRAALRQTTATNLNSNFNYFKGIDIVDFKSYSNTPLESGSSEIMYRQSDEPKPFIINQNSINLAPRNQQVTRDFTTKYEQNLVPSHLCERRDYSNQSIKDYSHHQFQSQPQSEFQLNSQFQTQSLSQPQSQQQPQPQQPQPKQQKYHYQYQYQNVFSGNTFVTSSQKKSFLQTVKQASNSDSFTTDSNLQNGINKSFLDQQESYQPHYYQNRNSLLYQGQGQKLLKQKQKQKPSFLRQRRQKVHKNDSIQRLVEIQNRLDSLLSKVSIARNQMQQSSEICAFQ